MFGRFGDLQMTIEHLSAALTLAQQIGFMLGYIAKWRRTGEAPEFIRVQRRMIYYRVALAALRVAAAMAWYNSPEYQAIKHLRTDNSEGTAVVVDQWVAPASK